MITFCIKRTNALFIAIEKELNATGRTVTMLLNEDIHDIFALCFRVVVIFAVDKCHNVSVLLDGS